MAEHIRHVSATLDAFVARGNKQDEFIKDLVVAFTSANIPLEKLKKNEDGKTSLVRQFLEKYLKVDGETPQIPSI